MHDASSLVLGGYQLPTEEQTVMHGQRFFDKNGAEMWRTIMALLDKLEPRSA